MNKGNKDARSFPFELQTRCLSSSRVHRNCNQNACCCNWTRRSTLRVPNGSPQSSYRFGCDEVPSRVVGPDLARCHRVSIKHGLEVRRTPVTIKASPECRGQLKVPRQDIVLNPVGLCSCIGSHWQGRGMQYYPVPAAALALIHSLIGLTH
jgi:hypothetical protein